MRASTVHRAQVVVPAPTRRRLRRAVPVLCTAVLLNIALAFIFPQVPSAAASSVVGFVRDDSDAGLFRLERMHPGRVDTACVALSANGSAQPQDQVVLTAEVTERELAPYLAIAIDLGTVGRFGDCAGFTGERIWAGTLEQMPGNAVSGISTGWRPRLQPRAVFRFTVTILDDNRAQSRSAHASFVWTLRAAGSPLPPPVPIGMPQPSATPPPQRSTTGTSSPTTPLITATTPALPLDGGAGAERADLIQAPPLQPGPSTVEKAAQVVRAIARDGHFPLILLIVLVAFLMLQGAFDRRDPKLALARVREDLSEFQDFPEALREQTP